MKMKSRDSEKEVAWSGIDLLFAAGLNFSFLMVFCSFGVHMVEDAQIKVECD